MSSLTDITSMFLNCLVIYSVFHLFWKNPQFSFTLKDVDEKDGRNTCTLVVCLTEKEKNKKSGSFAIGFRIYKVDSSLRRPLDRETAPISSVKDSGKYDYSREVTRRFDLSPGTYVIIPSTFNPHEEASFMLRLFTERKVDNSVVDEEIGGNFKPENDPMDSTKALFVKHAGEAGKLRAKKLKMFLFDMSKEEFKEPLEFATETCRSLITLMDRNKSGGLEFEEAVQIWKDTKNYRTVFQRFDNDDSGYMDTYELNKVFQTIGFPINRMVKTAIVRRYGDEDNKISLTDFITVVCKLTMMFQIFKDHQKDTGEDESASFSMNEVWFQRNLCIMRRQFPKPLQIKTLFVLHDVLLNIDEKVYNWK